MNKHNPLNEDEMAEIETRAIAEVAKRWSIDEKLVDEIMQDYTDMIEHFEGYINERYPDDYMKNQPYVVMEITKKVTRDITNKRGMDEEEVSMIIQDYTALIDDSLEQEMLEELD